MNDKTIDPYHFGCIRHKQMCSIVDTGRRGFFSFSLRPFSIFIFILTGPEKSEGIHARVHFLFSSRGIFTMSSSMMMSHCVKVPTKKKRRTKSLPFLFPPKGIPDFRPLFPPKLVTALFSRDGTGLRAINESRLE